MTTASTYTGLQIDLFNPTPEMINIEDIAHHLAMLCRFGGAVDEFYSVAEHSWLISHAAPPGLARLGLLHDAAEAYIGDMRRPLKHHEDMLVFRRVEHRLEYAIAKRFGLSGDPGGVINALDKRICYDETAQLWKNGHSFSRGAKALGYDTGLGVTIEAWDPRTAEVCFLQRFYELFPEEL